MFGKLCLLLVFMSLALLVWPRGGVVADDTTVIRMATIAPKSSKPMRILRAWDKTVRKSSEGRIRFRFYSGGIAGDERDVIRKMRIEQLDATSLTSVGLGQIERSASVLQVPGLFRSYRELDAVRSEMDLQWRDSFREAGFELLGWFDVGFGRYFSRRPVKRPSDLKGVRPWVWRDDPVFPELMKVVGANGVALGLPEVLPGLQTGMVDTVVASPVAALGLQWFRHLKYMSKQADTALVGATLIRTSQFSKLTPADRELLLETGSRAHGRALKLVQSEEEKAYQILKQRGIQELDMSAHAGEWQKSYAQLAERLTGRLFRAPLLQRVREAAARARR